MKNLFLILAMLVLVGGCVSKTPDETTTADSTFVLADDSTAVAIDSTVTK